MSTKRDKNERLQAAIDEAAFELDCILGPEPTQELLDTPEVRRLKELLGRLESSLDARTKKKSRKRHGGGSNDWRDS